MTVARRFRRPVRCWRFSAIQASLGVVFAAPRFHRLVWLACIPVLATQALWLSGQALAHVAPAVDVNNRYLRITPMRDGVRLAYTVFVGEVPGAAARQRMDTDKNGIVDDGEAQRYGDELARTVAATLAITIDDTAATEAMKWTEVHAGMGSPEITAGAFSVDLIAWICAGADAGSHRMHLVDGYSIPRPGETELQVTSSPGVTIVQSILGEPDDAKQPIYEIYWEAEATPLAKDGYTLAYTVDRAVAPPMPAGVCASVPATAATADAATASGEPSTRKPGQPFLVLAGLVVLALLGLFAAWLVFRSRARRTGTSGRRESID